MRFGDVPVTQRTYHEEFFTNNVNMVVGIINAAAVYHIANFTMPFDGRAKVSFWGKFSWRYDHQMISLSMSDQSIPPPSDTADIMILDGLPGPDFTSENDIESHCIWNTLTAGQVVQMKFRVYVGNSPATPTFSWAAALVRMYRV